MPNLPARAPEGRISEERKSEEREHLRRHSIETVPDEDLKVEIEESSDSDSEENPNIGNESLSESAKS